MKKLISSVAAFAAATSAAFADAIWDAAVDGNWRTPTLWTDSIEPSSSHAARLTPVDAAYTVTLGSGADVTTAGLTISGKDTTAYSTKLNVTGTKLTIDGTKPTISYGSITVNEGAEVEFKNVAGARLDRGGKIEVNGGTFVMTNGISGTVSIGNSTFLGSGGPMLEIKSGTAYFKGSTQLMYVNAFYYGMIKMTGGKVVMIDSASNRNTDLLWSHGGLKTETYFSMSGDSELSFPQGGGLTLGNGISEFKDNAKLTITSPVDKNYLRFSTPNSDSNKKITVNVSDNATITANALRYFEFGKADFRTLGTQGEFNISGGDIELGYSSTLGAGIGKYSVNMTGGKIDFRRYGVRIGTVPFSPANTQNILANTTTVTVAGGRFACTAEQSHNNTPRDQMWGFIVGAGLVGRTAANLMNGWVDGRINLQSGGTVTNGCALKVFGVGRGTGSMTQTGGTYIGDSALNGGSRLPDALVLGAFGGEGLYDMQGGTATLRCPLFVGGTTLSLIQRTDSGNWLPANTDGLAKGRLKISGNSAMTVSYESYVGYDGQGTIDVSGNGSLTFQSSLTFTNSVADAATLKVTLADEAMPTFRIDGALTVHGDAKLVVDAKDFNGDDCWTKIIDVRGGRTGSFDSANITLIGQGEVVQNRSGDSTGSIWLRRSKGFQVIIF